MYMNIYVCMYIFYHYMCICICISTCICIRTCICTCTYIYICICKCLCMYVCMYVCYIQVHMHVCLCCIHTGLFTEINLPMYYDSICIQRFVYGSVILSFAAAVSDDLLCDSSAPCTPGKNSFLGRRGPYLDVRGLSTWGSSRR